MAKYIIPQRRVTALKSKTSVTQAVNRALLARQEHKSFNYQQGPTTMTIVGTVINLSNNIVQGDDSNQRSGNTIRMIHQLLIIRMTGLTFNSTNRFILVRDNENNGTTPAVTDVLESGNFMSGYQGREVIQQKRFTILKDWVTNNNLNGNTLTSLVYENTNQHNLYYNGATAIASSNGKGSLYLLAVGSTAAGAFDMCWQGTYTDS